MQPDRDRLGSTFDTIAEQYERARPNYPPALIAARPGGTVTKHYRHDLVIARRR